MPYREILSPRFFSTDLASSVRTSKLATNLPSCFFIQFLEQLVQFLENFTLLKYVKSQRSYGFLITKELIFGFQFLDLKNHFSASLRMLKSDKNPEFGSRKISFIAGQR